MNVFMNSMLTFVLVMDSKMEISVQLLQSIDDSFPAVRFPSRSARSN